MEKAASTYEDRGNAHFHSNTKALDFGGQFTLNDSEATDGTGKTDKCFNQGQALTVISSLWYSLPILSQSCEKKLIATLKDKEKVCLNSFLLPSSPSLPSSFSPFTSLLLSLFPSLYCPPLGQYLEIFDMVCFV